MFFKKSLYFHTILKMVWNPLFWIIYDIENLLRLIN